WEQKETQLLDGTAGAFLAAVNEKLSQPKAANPEPAIPTDRPSPLDDYRKALLPRVDTVRLFGEEISRPLEKVFVQLNILEEYRHPADRAQWLGLMDAELRRRRMIFVGADDEVGNSEKPFGDRAPRVIQPDELLRRRSHTIIAGAPGCGKT